MASLVIDFFSTVKKTLFTPIAFGMLIVQLLSGILVFLIVPFFDIITGELGMTMTLIGLEEGLYSISYGIGSIIWGYLVGKVEKRRYLLIFALLGSIVGTWLAAIAVNAYIFIIGRAIMGFSISVAYPVNTSIAADIFPAGERVRFYSLLLYAEMFGMSVSPAIGIIFLPYTTWRNIILVFILVEMVALLFIIPVREPPRGAAEEELKKLIEMGAMYTGVLTIEGLKKIAKRKSNVVIIIQAFFAVWAWGVYGRWLLYYFMSEFNVSKLLAGAFIIIMGFAMVIAFPLQSYMDKIRKEKGLRQQVIVEALLIAAFASLFVVMFLIPHTPYNPVEFPLVKEEKLDVVLDNIQGLVDLIFANPTLIMTLSIGFWAYFLAAPTGSTAFSVLSEVNLPEERGIVVALEKFMEYVGQAVGLTITGFLLDYLSVGGSYEFGLVLLISTFMWYLSFALWYLSSKWVEQDHMTVKEEIKERIKE